MEALEQGLPAPIPPDPEKADRQIKEDEDPQVWLEDGIWWTVFPPPAGFDGEEEGEIADGDYQRTLTADEEAVMKARNRAADEAELARCCAVRDRYFGLAPRGCSESFFPQGSRNNEPSETSGEEEEGWGEGPIEYKSMEPPCPSPAFRGRGGAQAEGLGGEGLHTALGKTLTSRRSAAGPSSPVRTGEGYDASLPYPHRRFRSIAQPARLWGKHG
jgi:hypothetical protein